MSVAPIVVPEAPAHPCVGPGWLPAGTGVAWFEEARVRHERAVAARAAALRAEADRRAALNAVRASLRQAARAAALGAQPDRPEPERVDVAEARVELAVEDRQRADAALLAAIEDAAQAIYHRGRDLAGLRADVFNRVAPERRRLAEAVDVLAVALTPPENVIAEARRALGPTAAHAA